MAQNTGSYSDESVPSGSVGYPENDYYLPSECDLDLPGLPPVESRDQNADLPEQLGGMEAAIRACRSGVPITTAARQCGVERTTLRYKLKGEHAGILGYQSRKFSDSEEKYFADLLMALARAGVPLDKPLFKKVVEVAAINKGYPQEKARMTDTWHRAFLHRHPEISIRITHARDRKKAREWTVENCTEWVTTLSELHAFGYLSDPRGLFNLDESGFTLAEKVKKVYAPRGQKEILSYADGSDRDVVSTLFCGRADGLILRPFVLFAGMQHLHSRIAGTADRCYISYNHSGSMDEEIFADYVRKEIFPNMIIEKNVIFVDGHFLI
ncbi:uncharacterized protein LOC129595932 [Paramacrobiotus metropolitanus]|uniref:uncharacterized protein LOC129595932 n=1 Tax=Paramacrobiotus metropolitanus TaxID=2943436 RepID=UPI002445C6FD|nr:uncharacterized protein LOC129595932 [Paramacrobiotus metropolitanus]